MPSAVLLALVLLAVAAAVRGSSRAAATVLVGTWLLVPGTARVPYTGDGQLLIHRVVIAAVLAGLVRRAVTDAGGPRRFGVRGVHLAFGSLLVVTALVGVVFADARTEASHNLDGWLALAEQAAFFVAALGVFRELGARRSVEVISLVAGALATIAISEHLLHWSYSRWFAAGIPDPTGLMRLPLEQRGPHVRIRASTMFALELGWVLAMVAPVTIAGAIVATRRPIRSGLATVVAWAAPGLVLLALVWTWSRSPYAGLAVGVGTLVLGVVLDRPRQVAAIALGCVLVAVLVLESPVREAMGLATAAGEEDVRVQRLPDILEPPSSRPLTGLGFGGLLSRGIFVVDNGWVTMYATIGVVGVVALGVLLLTAIHSTSRFVRAGPADERVIAGAAAGAVAASLIANGSYDFITLRASTATLWGLAALGLVANEELGVLPRPLSLRRPPRRVWVLAAVGAVAGVVALALTSPRSSTDAVFTTTDPLYAAIAPNPLSFTAKVLAQTGCGVIADVGPPGAITCRDLDQLAGGIGKVRIEGATDAEVRRWQAEVEQRLRAAFPAATLQVERQGRGRPAVVATAPLWAGAVGAAMGALIPPVPAGGHGGARPAPRAAGPAPARPGPRRPTPTG